MRLPIPVVAMMPTMQTAPRRSGRPLTEEDAFPMWKCNKQEKRHEECQDRFKADRQLHIDRRTPAMHDKLPKNLYDNDRPRNRQWNRLPHKRRLAHHIEQQQLQ